MMLQDQQNYQPAKDLLAGKSILITGAGSGIGKAVAIAFAQHGAHIILLGKTLKRLNKTYDEIEQSGGAKPAIYQLNLETATLVDYQQMAAQIGKEFGHLDGLIHNAATLKLLSSIEDYDAKTWFEVMQVNLNAPFLITQTCLPLLQKAQEAAILFTSDTVGRTGKAYWGAYGAAKFGIEGLMQTLAEELDNTAIRVNSIDPGKTRTDLHRLAYPGIDPNNIKEATTLTPYYLWIMGKDGREAHGQALAVE